MVLLMEPAVKLWDSEPKQLDCCQVCSRVYSSSTSLFRRAIGKGIKLLKFKRVHSKSKQLKEQDKEYFGIS